MSRLLLAALLVFGLLPRAEAVQLPIGFNDQLVVSGLASPVAVAFHPDGRLLILEKGGAIRQLLPGQTALDALPYLVLSDTESGGERGLLNIALAPDFDISREFYIYYTSVLSNRNRIVRYTEVGGVADPASEMQVWEDNEPWSSCCHHGGGLAFGPDGLIYATTGEEFDALQAQDPTRSGGKVIRIAPDGTIPIDNPFVDGPGGNDDSVWAMGLRNPFRMTWDLESATMLIGEVGGNTGDSTEDVHVFHDPSHGEPGHHGLESGRGSQPWSPTSALSVRANGPATRGLGTLSPEPGASFQLGTASPEAVNFGWPSCAGFCGNPFFSDPVFSYPHNGSGAAIIGGYVNRGNQFPAEYDGAYFFADYVGGWIRYLTFDALGAVATDVDFQVGINQPVFLGQGPLGSLYYLELSGDLRRIVYEDGNQAPTIQSVGASPATGPGPTLDVQFTALASDAESDALTYHWIFGDGQDAFGQTLNHLYTSNGVYTARLEVADASHTTLSNDLSIAVGSPPVATILSPIDGSSFVGRQIIQLMGTGTDPDEALSEASYDWTVTFLHNEHTHPGDGPFLGTSSAAFEISSSNHDFHSTTGFLITLTVTDSDGLQSQDSVSIYPQKVNLTLDTTPSGLTILLDGLPLQTPLIYDTMVGFEHFIETFTPQCLGGSQYAFDSWSDAGDMAHLITVPVIDTSYGANFNGTGNCQVAVSGQIALYTFGEGSGARIHDVSRLGAPLDLTIPDPAAVVWSADGIEIVMPTLIRSEGPATKITSRIRASQEMSFEVWVDPSSLGQSGPARVVTLSDPGIGNAADFMLGQTAGDSFETRLRTLLTNQYGLPALNSGLGSVRTSLTHLVYTRDSSSLASIYLDGALVRSGTIAGAHSSWDTAFELGFGNSFTLDRTWLGSLHLVAFYDRALSPTDVAQNFAAGPNGGSNSFPVAVVTTDITQGIAPLTVQFDASTSSDSDGQVVDWSWDFDDGFGALGSAVSHTFTAPGNYDVRLTVTDDNGARSSNFVTITAQAGAPLIVSQPMDSQTMEGQDATFSLVAEGVAPVTYQWRRNGAEITGATTDTLVVPAVTQADHLATFDCVVSNGLGDATSDPTTLSVLPSTGRTLEGLVLYYPFDDASGALVTDQSGFGVANDLVIDDLNAVTWINGGGLSIDSATRLATALPASKVRTAVQASGELTLEVWARPADAVQSGPARILAYSEDGYPNGGNLILGQSSAFESRLRTTTTNQYGLPGLSSGNGSAITELTHVLLTRSSMGFSELHINGALVASNSVGGDLSNWADSIFVVANEPPGDRPWLGEMHLVAVYDRALSDAEIQQNYLFGSGGTPNIPPTADFTATPSSGVAPLNSSFDASASDDVDGTIVEYAWDFGDGSVGSGIMLGHVFAGSGTFDVTLTVTDDGGRQANRTAQVVVSPSPVPSFTLQPLSQSRPEGQNATFTVEADGAMPLAYQWQRDGVDMAGETDPMLIVPGVSLADDGALFRCTVSNGFGMDISDPALLGVIPTSGRISTNLLALYQFAAGSGDTVLDLSGVQPALDLTIADTNAALWIPGGGIDVQSATQISNAAPASKLNDALAASSEVTLEAWLQSTNVSQSGPARIVALSVDGYPTGGNLILGQSSIFEQRLRTTRTRQYGTPGLSTDAGSVTPNLTHYVYTRDMAGNTTIYLDGAVASTGSVAGDFSSWSSACSLALANEPTGDRPWLGKLFLVACFDRALDSGEVLQNFQAGPGITPNTAPTASFIPNVISGTAALVVNVDASLSDDPDGVIQSFDWDFGDGSSGTGEMTSHTYLASGSFTLALTVTDDFGATDTTSTVIDVAPSPDVIIVTQPAPASVLEDQIASFSVVATGAPPLSYQWQRDLVDLTGATAATYSTPGSVLADDGASFRCVISNSTSSEVSDAAILSVTPAGARVTDGLVSFYDFMDGGGATVRDRSGVAPALDLSIDDPGATSWLAGGGLDISSPTTLRSLTPASKITSAVQASGALTVELWCKPASPSQSGPARILALSQDGFPVGGNLIVGQGSRYSVRFRTDSTDQYGLPGISGPGASTTLTHLVFTRDTDGATALHVNDALASVGSSAGGLGAWGDYVLALANEPSGDRPWRGTLFLVALYNRVLSDIEIAQNFDAGPGTVPIAPMITSQPTDQAAPEGSPATFTVVATGTQLQYQWERFDAALWNALPGGTSASYTTPDTVPADDGASFRCLISNGVGSVTSASALLTILAPSPRVVAGLLALYQFEEGSGLTVADTSGSGPALDLSIADMGAVTWIAGGGLSVDSSVIISSGTPATKIIDAVSLSDAITLEAWIRPTLGVQSGPARVIALSTDGGANGANAMLGQTDRYEARLLTSNTNRYGLPGLATAPATASTGLTHVVYSRDPGGTSSMYIDGMLVSSGSSGGTTAVWDPTRPLVLANEPPGDRPWLGELHLVALFKRALTPNEVAQNFAVGPHPVIE